MITDIWLQTEHTLPQVFDPTVYDNGLPEFTSPARPLYNLDVDIEKLDLQTPVTFLRSQARVNKNSARPIIAARAPQPPASVLEVVVITLNPDLPIDFETIRSIEHRIGSDQMQYRCRFAGCEGTFGRLPDFTRHYDGRHAYKGPKFWCPVLDYPRSEENGGKPFPRKDKMMEHVQKMQSRLSDQVRCKRRRHA